MAPASVPETANCSTAAAVLLSRCVMSSLSETPVSLPAKHVPHFKPGKELRERVDEAYAQQRSAGRAEAATPSVGSATEALSGATVDPASAD